MQNMNSTEDTDQTNKGKTSSVRLIALFIIVVIVWIAYMLLVRRHWPGWPTQAGLFGDSFGGINALFSGLAFAGIIYTIFLQKEELKLQRDELKQTRLEFATQNDTLKKQRFENTFFHLVDLHNEIVDKLYITKDELIMKKTPEQEIFYENQKVLYTKREFFKRALRDLRGESSMEEAFDTNKALLIVLNDGYRTFNFEYADHLSHYFRNLYHIYKYIHLSNLISEEEKEFYASIIRAQLSNNELTLIFYNMLVGGLGYPNFKYLDQKYDILQNIDYNSLFHSSHENIFHYAKVSTDPFIVS